MGLYFYLVCHETKKMVMLGKDGGIQRGLLQSKPEPDGFPIGPFLIEHKGQPLFVVDEHGLDDLDPEGDYHDAEWADYA